MTPSCERIRGSWGCRRNDWAGVAVCAASVSLPRSRVTIRCSIAGSVRLVGAGVGGVRVSWTIRHCGATSTRLGIGWWSVTRWRISLPVWTVSCVASGERFLSH